MVKKRLERYMVTGVAINANNAYTISVTIFKSALSHSEIVERVSSSFLEYRIDYDDGRYYDSPGFCEEYQAALGDVM